MWLRPLLRHRIGIGFRQFASTADATSSEIQPSESAQNLKRIGRALESYLRQSRENSNMMARERAEFDLGKRHLANIMGIDAHSMTQADIDKAVEYLFPSGLSDKQARPVMKPPDEILPTFNKYSFDDEGRPVDARFYTYHPKFYTLLSEIGQKTRNIIQFHAELLRSNKDSRDELQTVTMSGTAWLTAEKMRKRIGEKFSDEMYAHLILALDHLSALPGSVAEEKFIEKFREPLAAATSSKIFGVPIPEVQICKETKRRFTEVTVRVKHTKATVKVFEHGTGKWDIDATGFSTFRSLTVREILLCPLIVTNLIGQVDVVATSEGSGGETAVPRAVRHGVSLGLAALFPANEEKLRLAGLLTTDPRTKERSKVNQPGARAKWIWKRR
ncbi:unnamed protein product, partial [Mesorhabditis spiculigera]